jgi:HlyD family secretion protein
MIDASAQQSSGAGGEYMPLRSVVAMLGILSITFTFGCGGRSSSVRASGVVEMDEIDVASFEGGRIVRLNVAESDSVRAGDTLAVLHRSELTAQVEAQVAEANRLSAQSQEVKTGPRAEDIRIARATWPRPAASSTSRRNSSPAPAPCSSRT